jgi:hypothetical protein
MISENGMIYTGPGIIKSENLNSLFDKKGINPDKSSRILTPIVSPFVKVSMEALCFIIVL